MPALGITEILIIATVVLVLFGSKEMPGMLRKISKGWRNIQNAADNVKKEMTSLIDEDDDLLG